MPTISRSNCASSRATRYTSPTWCPSLMRYISFLELGRLQRPRQQGPNESLSLRAQARVPISLNDVGSFPRKLASFAGPGDGFSGLAVSRAAALGFALVPQLFSLGQGKFNLHSAVFEVHASGNESQSLLLGFADELLDISMIDPGAPKSGCRFVAKAGAENPLPLRTLLVFSCLVDRGKSQDRGRGSVLHYVFFI